MEGFSWDWISYITAWYPVDYVQVIVSFNLMNEVVSTTEGDSDERNSSSMLE